MRKNHTRPAHHILRDERGNVAITFGLMFIPILGIMGAAIDYSRLVSVQTRLQAAADTAALAALASRSLNDTTSRIAMAKANFRSNFNPSDPASAPEPQVNIDGNTVTVTASDVVDTTLLSLLNVDQLAANAESHASVSGGGRKLEVGMMIDLTGSMGQTRNGSTKIEGLKEASADLLNILLPTDGSNDGLVRIAVAPFADYVNAGPYAVEATGENATGPYNNLTNLKSTRNGTFTGRYSQNTIGNSSGSQAGSTSPSSGAWAASSGTVTTGGDTYSSGHCDNPTEIQVVVNTTNAPVYQSNNKNTGESVSRAGWDWNRWSGAAPAGMMKASENNYYDIDEYDNGWDFEGYSTTSGYYVPLVTNSAGLTQQSRSADVCTDYRFGRCRSYTTRSGPVGEAISVDHGTPPTPHALSASAQTGGGYWHVSSINTDGTLSYEWKTTGYFLPMYNSLTSSTSTTQTVTLPQCTTTTEPQGQLITCVTDREGDEAYTDAGPAEGSYVGSYNHGNTNKNNYSEDGKCYTAGRELPQIIPLTGDRSTIEAFFTNAKIGGATPGHLGTAWAWYLISPLWNSVFGTAAAEYNDEGTKKVAILMTDGEYNIHYADASARTQALALCTAMKNAGVTIYTIGFGFSTTSTAADDTTEGRAKDLMTQCSSGTNHYYFPYDSDDLKQAFSSIGNDLMDGQSEEVVKITN